MGRICARLIEFLPQKFAVTMKENLDLIGKLDYDRCTVLMNLESLKELARLHACQKEPETVAWLENKLRPGDVLYDIGANVGAYCFLASKIMGGKIKVFAFEPSFSSFAELCKNALLNDCHGTVMPLQIALSDRTELQRFNYRSVSPGAALHSLGPPIDYAGRHFEPFYEQQVLSFRIDNLIDQFGIEKPNLIKLDVDGTELKVLQGAGSLLSRNELRSIMVEVNKDLKQASDIALFLEGNGFRLEEEEQHGMGNIVNLVFEKREF
jgi:FkbM family methyltransferase